MKKEERVMSVTTLVLAVIIMEAIIFGGFGVGVVVSVISYFVGLAILTKIYNKKMTKISWLLLIPIVLCTLCFVLFSNYFLKFLNTLFLLGLILIQNVELWQLSEAKIFESGWGKQIISLGVKLPFSNINKPFLLVKEEVSTQDEARLKVIKKVLLGIIMAMPMLIIVVCLLLSADAAFAGVMDAVFNRSNLNVEPVLKRLIVGCILFVMLFSAFYGLAYKKEANKELQQQPKAQLDFIIVATVGTMLCLVYIIFCFSQLAYFISAFKGVLPEEFTFAEYARRGFFENIPLTLINLGVIWILEKVVRETTGKKKVYTQMMSNFVALFTLFMSVCAFSKLWMYIQNYGLTLLRVYVTWLLALSSLMIVLILVRNIWNKLPLMKVTFIMFTIMYLGLNYANVDYLIAKQNAVLYEKTEGQNLSAYYNLSTSAMGMIGELAQKNTKVLEEGAVKGILRETNNKSYYQKWQAWTVADYRAIKTLEEMKNDKKIKLHVSENDEFTY